MNMAEDGRTVLKIRSGNVKATLFEKKKLVVACSFGLIWLKPGNR